MPRPLEGFRVIGTEQYMAGPYCTMMLADAGAEVIKIERPGVGDPRRAMPPFVGADSARKAVGFMGYNRNKRSVALDLRSEKGQAVFRRLLERSDALVDNLRPGALDRLGFGYEDVAVMNPRLVYAVISGFGRLADRQGPYADRPAFDIVTEAMGGIMHQVGFEDRPPSWTIYGMADVYSGLTTAYGVVTALLMRERTGVGQMVDSAMFDNMLSLNERAIAMFGATGESPHRGRPNAAYPRGAYEASDGWIALNVPDERIWERLAKIIGRPELTDDMRTSSGPARCANRQFVDDAISGWLAARTRDEAVTELNEGGVPVGPVNTAEDIFADPHVQARGMIMDVEDPDVGTQRFARTSPVLSAAPDLPATTAPRLGEHTREVLEGICGYSSAEVDDLASEGVVELAE